MHVISRKKLLQAAQKHRDLGKPLDVWYRIAKKAKWKSLVDVRQLFPGADAAFEPEHQVTDPWRMPSGTHAATGTASGHPTTVPVASKGQWPPFAC